MGRVSFIVSEGVSFYFDDGSLDLVHCNFN
jgi:hypothetical protein